MKVVGRVAKKRLPKDIISDETILLDGERTRSEYPERLRRVAAHLFIDGKWRNMVFITNNFAWSAATIAALYKARCEVELLFKELKQTLQPRQRLGETFAVTRRGLYRDSARPLP